VGLAPVWPHASAGLQRHPAESSWSRHSHLVCGVACMPCPVLHPNSPACMQGAALKVLLLEQLILLGANGQNATLRAFAADEARDLQARARGRLQGDRARRIGCGAGRRATHVACSADQLSGA